MFSQAYTTSNDVNSLHIAFQQGSHPQLHTQKPDSEVSKPGVGSLEATSFHNFKNSAVDSDV